MRYGYGRVSTKGQAKDGNSLEAQEAALRNAGAEKFFADKFTGTKKHRPQLDLLMNELREGDTLIVTKLDRLARSTMDGCQIIEELIQKGISVHVLNMGIMDNTPSGKLIRTVMFAFAEFERDMIVERTNEGKAIAKQSPTYREGRPCLAVPGFDDMNSKVKNGELSICEAARNLGISRGTWYRLARSSDQSA